VRENATMPYNVYLVQIVDFPDDSTLVINGVRESPSQRERIQMGVEQRLQQLFGQVSGGDAVALHWVPGASASQVRPSPNEIVIYFVDTYMRGVIFPQMDQLRLRAASPRMRQHYNQQHASALPPAAGQPLPEFGLTFTVRPNDIQPGSGAPWVVSEVYVGEIMRRAFAGMFPRNRYMANFMNEQQNRVGALIAETAFHEALHNKLDPNRPRGWDMHSLGGLAAGTGANMNRATRNMMIQRLHQRLERQYVPGTNQLPMTPVAPAPAAPVTSPSSGLTNLSHVPTP
jgi:hypothetical protein